MEKNREKKIVLVTRKTRLDQLIARYNTIGQAKFVLEHAGSDFQDYVCEDQIYKQNVAMIRAWSEQFCQVQEVDRDFIPNYIFGDRDIVVAVGQDGLVVNVLKYLTGQPLIGVNPDPDRFDGVLLPFKVEDYKKILPEVIQSGRSFKEITMAKVTLNDGQSLIGVNDLFIGRKTHVSAQYILQQDNKVERQSSSGIIISTGLGATGWLKGILAGASRIAQVCLHEKVDLHNAPDFKWDSDFLYYTVREPYPSNWTQTQCAFGRVEKRSVFKLQSLMPENGVIFSDGVEEDYLQFNSGTEAEISIADHKGLLVI